MSNEQHTTDQEIPVGTESCIEFPCQFPIKAMGKDPERVEKALLDAIERHAPESPRDDISRRASRTGKYSAVTVTITATSREQLDNIYQALTDSDDVTMAL